jgi:hypothetical protein
MDPDPNTIDFLSADDFVALGLDEITNPSTKALYDDSPTSLLSLLTPSIMSRRGEVILLFTTSRRFIGKDFSEQVMIEDIICVILG